MAPSSWRRHFENGSAVGAKTAYIEPGSPWENGNIESFNRKLRDELLNGEIFYTLNEAKIVIGAWRRHTTIPCDRIHRWATDRQHPKLSPGQQQNWRRQCRR